MKFIPVVGAIKSNLFTKSQSYQSLTSFFAYNSGIMEPSTGIYTHSYNNAVAKNKKRLSHEMKWVNSGFLNEFLEWAVENCISLVKFITMTGKLIK